LPDASRILEHGALYDLKKPVSLFCRGKHGALYDLKKPVSLFCRGRKNICKKNVVEIVFLHLKKAEGKSRLN